MNWKKYMADATAGLTVSFAAISLGAAFGAMSGRGAFAGMIGAAVIPIISSAFGGTRLQASGPTAPMTAVSSLTVAFAYDSFADKMLAEQFITLVFMLNAVFLLLAALLRLGKLISYVPNVVILGFMNGIAFLIWKDQFVKIFSIGTDNVMQGGIALNATFMLVTFGLIYGIIYGLRKLNVRQSIRSFISGVLWSIIIMTAIAVVAAIPAEKVTLGNTIGSFGEFATLISNYFPSEILTQEYIMQAIPLAGQLTLLAYLDSLLTSLVIDRMTHEKTKLNKELFAQGLANGTSALFQGIPGAQATIRSVLLIKEGAVTRLAGVLIGVFALLSILVFKDYLSLVPAAVFAGVLLKAGLDVCDKDFIRNYVALRWYNSAQRNIQFGIILYTTAVTVFFDLNIAVLTGTILYYALKYFLKTQDAESDLSEVSEQESKFATG